MKQVICTILVCFVLLFVSCANQSMNISYEKVVLNDTCLNTTKVLSKQDYISSKDLPLAAKQCYVYNDSLVIVVNSKLCESDFVQVLNINSKNIIATCLSKGNGKNEILSAISIISGKSLIVNDYVKSQVALVNLDSLIYHGSSYTPQVIKRKYESVPTVVPFKNIYLAENPYCFNSEKYDIKQGVEYNEPRFIQIKDLTKGEISNEYEFYTRNVAVDGQIIVNPENNKVMYASLTKSQIELYDQNLNLLKLMEGPIVFDDEYSIISNEKDAKKEVCFAKTVPYAFVSHYNSGKYVYLNFVGSRIGPQSTPMDLKSNILKFDWNGNYLDCYKVDRLVDVFTINETTSVMYATTYDSEGSICVTKMNLK